MGSRRPLIAVISLSLLLLTSSLRAAFADHSFGLDVQSSLVQVPLEENAAALEERLETSSRRRLGWDNTANLLISTGSRMAEKAAAKQQQSGNPCGASNGATGSSTDAAGSKDARHRDGHGWKGWVGKLSPFRLIAAGTKLATQVVVVMLPVGETLLRSSVRIQTTGDARTVTFVYDASINPSRTPSPSPTPRPPPSPCPSPSPSPSPSPPSLPPAGPPLTPPPTGNGTSSGNSTSGSNNGGNSTDAGGGGGGGIGGASSGGTSVNGTSSGGDIGGSSNSTGGSSSNSSSSGNSTTTSLPARMLTALLTSHASESPQAESSRGVRGGVSEFSAPGRMLSTLLDLALRHFPFSRSSSLSVRRLKDSSSSFQGDVSRGLLTAQQNMKRSVTSAGKSASKSVNSAKRSTGQSASSASKNAGQSMNSAQKAASQGAKSAGKDASQSASSAQRQMRSSVNAARKNMAKFPTFTPWCKTGPYVAAVLIPLGKACPTPPTSKFVTVVKNNNKRYIRLSKGKAGRGCQRQYKFQFPNFLGKVIQGAVVMRVCKAGPPFIKTCGSVTMTSAIPSCSS
ncbi:hypothetical protein CLOM_g20175 [Closterium sp. NIES-68]|nr:hypothetical protein CLOM_g20175 [Closterium sp. NIES-68]